MKNAYDVNLDDTQYDKAYEEMEREEALIRDLETDFNLLVSTLSNFASEFGDKFGELQFSLVAYCAVCDWELDHINEAREFMLTGLEHIVAESPKFKHMVLNMFEHGEYFDTREIDLADLFFMYVWHQDRRYADQEITNTFDDLIEIMAKFLSKQH